MISLTSRLLAIAMSASTLLLTNGCSNTPQEQRDTMNDKMEKVQDKMDEANKADTRQEWVEDKNAVAKDLRDLQTNIADKLANTEEKLADKSLKADERRKQEAMRAELRKEKDIVGEQLASVEGATDANWNTVKSDARKAMDDIKIWWDKQEEKIDRKTDADKDNDGH